MALTKIVKKLTENHREFLLSQTPRSTPDNPTESGWSASKIRQYQWQGFSTLFTLLDSVESRVIEYLNNTVTTAIDGNSGDIAILTTNIRNEVIRATNAEQNLAISINNTLTSANGYTDTKFGTLNEKISNILSGELTAKKAETDSYGRKIQADRYYANLSVSVSATTGMLQFTFYNAFGEVVNTVMADTNLERIASIFDYDETTKMLYVIDYKGDRHEIDLSSLIDTYVAENQGHDCIVTIDNYKVSVDLPTETKTDIAKGVTAYNKAIDLEDSVAGLNTTKADKADTYNKTETNTLLAGKQDTLVSGENIKTINGVSLLGSGDYDFDTALNENSTNAVQNKVITEYITDLESKVSTLAVKVYNHDIALGTLNIENVLYSVANTDSFAIPTTIGTNADVVIPKSRMALNTIKGKTEYSRNIIQNSERTFTFNANNKWLYLSLSQYCSEGATYTIFVSVDNPNIYVQTFPKYTDINNKSYTFTYSSTDSSAVVNIRLGRDTYSEEYANVKIKVMLVKGATTLTADSYVPYYTGLKNVELNSLRVYGKTDNYTELNANDKVSAIRYFYPTTTLSFVSNMTLVDKDGNVAYIIQVWVNHETLGTFTKIWRGNYNTMLINANTAGMNGVYKLDGVYTVVNSENRISYGALNATSVKPILPSSILPKTLPAYERLEVVDNGDDTYKIDLVSHDELHVGDEINSLWVGNPQSENYGSGTQWYLRLQNSSLSLDTQIWSSDTYGNRLYINRASYIANADEMVISGGIALFGGNDTYIDKTSTRRNIVVNFNNQLTFTEKRTDSSFFNSDFRNGEETRTTLIDGLSLDDVSAIIDTNDVVYADNSNAEYDVSIAETSVELLVNKTN